MEEGRWMDKRKTRSSPWCYSQRQEVPQIWVRGVPLSSSPREGPPAAARNLNDRKVVLLLGLPLTCWESLWWAVNLNDDDDDDDDSLFFFWEERIFIWEALIQEEAQIMFWVGDTGKEYDEKRKVNDYINRRKAFLDDDSLNTVIVTTVITANEPHTMLSVS